MKLLLLVACLALAFGQPINNEQQIAITNERQMRVRYNEMLTALQDFGVASDAFCKIVNRGNEWPLKEGRLVEIKADLFIKAWQKMYASDGWISVRKTER